MKYLEIKLTSNDIQEIIYIKKEDILMIRSKPDHFAESEDARKILIHTTKEDIVLSATKKDATALYKFFASDKDDHITVSGNSSISY